VVQTFLTILAVSTGIFFTALWNRRANGNGEYTPSDGSTYPKNEIVWYTMSLITRVIGNILFALFSEGLLKLCGKFEV